LPIGKYRPRNYLLIVAVILQQELTHVCGVTLSEVRTPFKATLGEFIITVSIWLEQQITGENGSLSITSSN